MREDDPAGGEQRVAEPIKENVHIYESIVEKYWACEEWITSKSEKGGN